MHPVIPCEKRPALKEQIESFAEALKTEAHKIGSHGLSEEEFYRSDLLAGAIQRIRGQYSATMHEKRDFVARVLRHMEDSGYIKEWVSAYYRGDLVLVGLEFVEPHRRAGTNIALAGNQ